MSTPRIEYIAANIKTAIDEVTTGNGFNQTLTAVRRKRSDFMQEKPEDGKVLVIQWVDNTSEKPAERQVIGK